MLPLPTALRLDSDALPFDDHTVAVRFVGRQAVIVAASTGLIAITGEASGLMPGGLCLPDPHDLARVRHAAAGATHIDLRSWADIPADRIDLTVTDTTWSGLCPPGKLSASIPPAPSSGSTISAAGEDRSSLVEWARHHPGSRSERRLSWTLVSEAQKLLAAPGRSPEFRGQVSALIGRGRGLTPSGDDLLIGLQAGLRARGRPDAAQALAAAVLPLVPRTTAISAHLLRSAAENRFAEPVHRILAAFRRRDPALLERAVCWGASSGRDTAAGILAALEPDHPQSEVA